MKRKGQKKKILFVMQLPPPIHGVSVMNKIIKDSSLINSEFNCDYVNLATAKNIDDLQKPGLKKVILAIGIVLKMIRKIVFTRYDFVYITIFPWGFAFVKDAVMVVLARLFRLNVLLHLHTHGFKYNSGKSKWRKKLYIFVFKNTRVICLSELLIEDIETFYRGEVYILPNGIPQVNFVNSYKVDQHPICLLYLSNLIKGKGILLLIESLALLKRKGKDFHCRVVGPEGDVTYADLKQLVAQLGLEEEVTMVGPRFGEDKHEEFRNAGIFILPSNYDTFGLVLLEAMQFGVPCISTNKGGIPDVLGQGRGIIIPEINAAEIAKALETLIDDKTRRATMSKAGFSYFTENFTISQFERGLQNILNGQPDKVCRKLQQGIFSI